MKLKRIFSIVLSVCICAAMFTAFTSCGSSPDYKIGILQLAPHEALDAATNGFKQALIDQLGEENVSFDLQNAAGDTNTCSTIATTFVGRNYDLILANATSALQAVANATTTIPLLGTSITDYPTALDLKNFSGTVGGNISGTSDLAPLAEQAAMISEMFPAAQNVGILYCSAEPNSIFQSNTVKAILEEKGLNCRVFTFSDSNDISSVAASVAAWSDVIYVPTDNTAASCSQTIYSAMGDNKKPIIAGEEGICKGCGVATLSISYYDLGYATGLMAAKILKGEANISEMPIEYSSATTKKYNATICEELGITPPEGYIAIAD